MGHGKPGAGARFLIELEEVLALCLGAGFQRAAAIAGWRLPAWAGPAPEPGTFVVCALSCFRREPQDLSQAGDPHGWIAPFARRHYYAEAVNRLRGVARSLAGRTGTESRKIRLFSNSRLPEKALAAASGLGAYGRNGLILAPGLGSLFIIAGMFLPGTKVRGGGPEVVSVREEDPSFQRLLHEAGVPLPGEVCGSCRACLEACPTGALQGEGRLERSLCLQEQAGKERELPPAMREVWGRRLYGCQLCQDPCPWNRALSLETETARGELGPSLSLPSLLAGTQEGMEKRFKGSALGLAWIGGGALLRNAILAAGSSGDPAVLPGLRRWAESGNQTLAVTARWALERIHCA